MARIPSSVTTLPNGQRRTSQQRGPVPILQQSGDRATNDIQRQVQDTSGPIKALPFSDGNLIKDVNFLFGVQVQLEHRLGRPYQGFIAMNLRSAGAVPTTTLRRPLAGDGDLAKHHITLVSDCDGVWDVWVY